MMQVGLTLLSDFEIACNVDIAKRSKLVEYAEFLGCKMSNLEIDALKDEELRLIIKSLLDEK